MFESADFIEVLKRLARAGKGFTSPCEEPPLFPESKTSRTMDTDERGSTSGAEPASGRFPLDHIPHNNC